PRTCTGAGRCCGRTGCRRRIPVGGVRARKDRSMFFVWFDPDPHKPIATKINEAAARYHQKHGYGPRVCLVSKSLNPQDYADLPGIRVVAFQHTRPAYFWLAQSENGDEAQPLSPALPTIHTEQGAVIDATQA